ncbi:XkdN-like protein [Paenibacillus albicereus]|uniref:XkdN-like protein n=1 Tax=Paenibacillus albicereus TaxID=2726185 RepID=A0A6H2GZC1_9BACL|nr:XkdN-like protein [Paenibacillus albicereus]QJC52784.1 XkdN-like protein [Paenibacillus albicereus]
MSALDLLLKIDRSKVTRPTKRVELPRLTALAGAPVEFKLQALTYDEQEEIAEIATSNGDVDQGAIRAFTILKGVLDPSLKDSELLKHYGVATPKELLLHTGFLLPGEIAVLYSEISDLSGFGEGAVVELKNE